MSGEPYCSNCGHNLTGLTDSSKCPECGLAIVDVLIRGMRGGRRWRTRSNLFGLPLVDIAFGPVPGESKGRARGIFAFGDDAVGLVAVGGVARGVVAVGGVALGLFAYGGIGIGVLAAWGGLAVGAIASGGVAIGGIVWGGVAIAWFASGGLPIGWYAMGGAPIGHHTLGPGAQSQELQDLLPHLEWFYGPMSGFTIWSMLQPLIAVFGSGLVATAVIGMLAVFAHWRQQRARELGRRPHGWGSR